MIVAPLCVLGLLATAAFGLAVRNARPAVYGVSALLCAVLAATGVLAIGGAPVQVILPLGIPWVGAHLRIDALSGFFLFVVNLAGTGASVYAVGYGRHEHAPRRVLPFYPAFLAGMNLVLLADDAFTFLFAWELMSVASWALVVSNHRSAESVRAGYVYLVMAAFSGMTLLLAFGLLAGPHGAYAFSAIRGGPLAAGAGGIVLLLAVVGAGAKAGLVPLHAWLPLAHPAAPSHVSALMSGAMTKVAVYGFLRIAFDLIGASPAWGGLLLLALGAATAVLGILYALMQTDLKTLLAYSTVENIGVIFIGIGLAMAFRAHGLAAAAAVALTAALFHALNHAVFKSLLFFGAGAILESTGTRDMERMGGLIHRMPRSAVAMLVGCAAISALPPLNGFVSEWLTFQAMLQPDLPDWGLKVMVPTGGALLALAAALAAACFVRVFGIAYLGRPRSPEAARARETDGFSFGAMAAAAILCLLVGVLPGVVVDTLAPAVHLLAGTRLPVQTAQAWLTLVPLDAAHGSYNGLLVLVFIAVCAGAAAAAIHRLASGAVRRAPAWDCGFPDARPATEYTAASFAQPLRRVFGAPLFGARERVTMPPPGDPGPARIDKTIRDPVWEGLYLPVAAAIARAADVMNRLQFLTIRRYLSFVFTALVLLLLALAMWQ